MRYLLDTHTFIWMESDPAQLSPRAATLIRDLDNTLLFSVATVWEIQIKSQIGKLNLKFPLAEVVQNQLQNNQIEVVPVGVSHVLELDHLPLHHRDPFDRLLVAQARVEKVILISADPAILKYDVQTIW